MRRPYQLIAAMIVTTCLTGCSPGGQEGTNVRTPASHPLILFNIMSSATEDPHAVTMAVQLAGHALDDGRDVVLFFNVRGVDIPTAAFPGDIAFRDEPIKHLLRSLSERGAEIHVCPHCMDAKGVDAEDLIPEALVTDREKLFSKITSNTVVFTY